MMNHDDDVVDVIDINEERDYQFDIDNEYE